MSMLGSLRVKAGVGQSVIRVVPFTPISSGFKVHKVGYDIWPM